MGKADAFVRAIAPLARRTYSKAVLGHLGASAGLFRASFPGLRDPVLVASADGVGSKILVAETLERFDTLGFDLVAMNVNDLLTTGARPLFFLDYLAIGRLDLARHTAVIRGIADACRDAQCTLLGGETAEMPRVYGPDGFDVAGFAVGVADRRRLLGRGRVRADDVLIGLPSAGLHSNGYALALRVAGWPLTRKDLLAHRADLGEPLGTALLRPTRIYVRSVLSLLREKHVHAVAHVTGGGLMRNLGRILPAGLAARVESRRWSVPRVFRWIRERGPVAESEMFRTFNMGIGLVLAVAPSGVNNVLRRLARRGEKAVVIGYIVRARGGPSVRLE